MQKRKRVSAWFVILTAAAALPVSSQAQNGSSKTTSLGIGGGLTLPTGDFSDCCGAGWNLGGFLQWRPANQVFGVRGDVGYSRNDYKDEILASEDLSSGNANILHFGVDGVMEVAPQGSSVGWYLLAGVAMYRVELTSSVLGGSSSESKTQAGFNAGGGLTFRMGGANLFVEGRWHTVKVDYGAGSSNPTFAYIPLMIGVRF